MTALPDEAQTTRSLREEIARLLPRARWFATQPEMVKKTGGKSFAVGFVGFADVPAGARALIATDSHTDIAITEAIAIALREKGVSVDVFAFDAGPDRPIEETDEVEAMMRNTPWTGNPRYRTRRYNEVHWVHDILESHGYDLYIQGRAYTFPQPCRLEGYPWTQAEQFLSDANTFPRDLHLLINRTSWAPVWETASGARVHITDPEGTDFAYTLFPEYWGPQGPFFNEELVPSHLMYHPGPPILEHEDATGVVAGTLAHFSKPFPLIELRLDRGRVEEVAGGGRYGDAWREIKHETDDVQYPCFPRPGLFWFWEAALGTNPKIRRPADVSTLSSGGTEWERFRSGLMHLGFGTAGPSEDEEWAGRQGITYGHLHVHLQFPTIELIRPDGSRERTVDGGRLVALDDPEVRALAATYGDPDEVLAEAWVPPVPGVSVPGELEVYTRDPARWFLG